MSEKRIGLKGVALLLSGFLAAGVQAHPHSFISMVTTPVVAQGKLTGLKMQWTMDDITSADLLYDAGDAGPDSPVWKKLAAEVMANVQKQNYFTEFRHNQKKVAIGDLSPEYGLSRHNHQAVLTFILPLAQPQPLKGQTYRFSTFDPTYFVDMSYDHDRDVQLPQELASGCKVSVRTPKPSEETLLFAQSLDKADAPPEDMALGRQFAQEVTLACQ